MPRTVRNLLVVASGALVAACGSTVSGTAGPVGGTATGHIAADLSTLLPDPSGFPARYPAVVLSGPATAAAAADLSGIQPGAQVQPDGCAPATPQASGTATVVGTDAATRSTVTIELTRTTRTLADVRDQLDHCGEVTAALRGATSTVRTEPAPAPAGDTLGLRRTVESHGARTALEQSMSTLLGQVADVRVNATFMTFGSAPADTATLEQLFTTTMDRVRAAR